MPNAIDNAIARLQDLVQECTSVTIKSAPDYPIENADPFPMSVGYISSGTFVLTNASTNHQFPVISLEVHFSRVNIKNTYQNINAIALELPRRLAADPTLNGNISSIVATRDQPISYTVSPFRFETGNVSSEMLKFEIPIKTLQTPTT